MFVRSLSLGRLLPWCVACLYCGGASGQATNSADVAGTVTDPAGAVVPDVTITVKDLDKNVERTLTTNTSGLYDTGPIVPTIGTLFSSRKQVSPQSSADR
jgi:Carboxypeptidase regulatory-like domain